MNERHSHSLLLLSYFKIWDLHDEDEKMFPQSGILTLAVS
ncbi:hypothetical protein BAT_0235 [Bacillus pumilus ATCC 7061]|nr:hypothetical protein BAT_0235 [Bacillus pumilus ATCC 7061]